MQNHRKISFHFLLRCDIIRVQNTGGLSQKKRRPSRTGKASRMTRWLKRSAHLLIFLLGALHVLGLGVLHGVPALLLHLVENLQLILADLHIAVVQHLTHAGLADLKNSK